MRMHLEIKEPCEFFWLRRIDDVDITQCCMKCFPGESDKRVFAASKSAPTTIDLEIEEPNSLFRPIAYYLCGLAKGWAYAKNTHVAFNPSPGDKVEVETDQIKLIITDAKEIHFQDYKPNPAGIFTQRQRACRNWIFANYVKDGMPL